jgi:hypothetical protein
MAHDLLEVAGKVADILRRGGVGIGIAGIDAPAVVGAVMGAAIVVVYRLDIRGGVGVALEIVELDVVGGDPVAGIDELPAA